MLTRRITITSAWRCAGLPVLALLGLLILSGCPKPEEQQEPPSDLAVEVPGTSINLDAGEIGTYPLPEPGQWPANFPQYAGAEIQSYEPNTGDQTSGFTMQFLTADNGEQVVEFYRDFASGEGYTETEAVTASDSGAVYFERDDYYLTLGYNAVPEGTTITVMVIPVQTTPESTAPAGSGRLPAHFPSDILKIYPGAEILSAENMPMDNMLDLHISNASRREVMDFYKAHFADAGFVIKRAEEEDTWASYLFEKEGFGGVNFNLSVETDGTVSLHQMLGRL